MVLPLFWGYGVAYFLPQTVLSPSPPEHSHRHGVTLEDPPLRIRHYALNGVLRTKITNLLDRRIELGCVQGYAEAPTRIPLLLWPTLMIEGHQTVTKETMLFMKPKRVYLEFTSIGYKSSELVL